MRQIRRVQRERRTLALLEELTQLQAQRVAQLEHQTLPSSPAPRLPLPERVYPPVATEAELEQPPPLLLTPGLRPEPEDLEPMESAADQIARELGLSLQRT